MNHFQEKNLFEFLLITVSRVHEDGRQFDSSNGFKNDNRDEIFCEIEIRFTILHFKFKKCKKYIYSGNLA